MNSSSPDPQVPFVSPSQHVDIMHRKHLAQIKMRENIELRQESMTNVQREKVVFKYEDERKRLLREKQAMLYKVTQISKIVGSGCECVNSRPQFLEFEQILHPYLTSSLAHIVVEYTGPPLIELSEEQKYVIQTIAAGHNVFFTGRAGTGKSLVLSALRKMHIDGVEFTALTGIAAINISGMTLHSFCGIGKGDGTVEQWIKKVRKSKELNARWNQCQCLVVDEVSMLSPGLFEKIDELARAVRRCDKPFGGLQICFVADFHQLPAVDKVAHGLQFCFQSPLWQQCFRPEHCLELTKIYRQSDETMTTFLNEIRVGHVSAKSLELLHYLKRPLCAHDGILPTKLKCLNIDVAKTNRENLLALNETVFGYRAIDVGTDLNVSKLIKSCNAEPLLEICVGAQVMLLRKLPNCQQLVNGSRGIVTKIEAGFPVVKFMGMEQEMPITYSTWTLTAFTKNNGAVVLAKRQQLPLRLAFATSIHKSQGLTLNKVSVNLCGVFTPGQAYVALSRARNLQSLQVIDFDVKKSFQTSQICVEFMKTMTHITQNMLQTKQKPVMFWKQCSNLENVQFLDEEAEDDLLDVNNDRDDDDDDDNDDVTILEEKSKKHKIF